MLSIIIPTLNEEKVIGQTLAALKSDLKVPHEIIVSDGGSRDETVAIAKKYTKKVVVYNGEKRQTIAQGRNDGAKAAKGEFFVFIDADCSIPNSNEFFELALAHFEKNENLAALTGRILVTPANETVRDKIIFRAMNHFSKIKNNTFSLGDAAGGEFQMVRREAFNKVNGYREDLVTREDRDLFQRISKIGKIFFDSNLVVYHTGRRVHQLGWMYMIGLLIVNTSYFHIFDKVLSKEWREIR